MSKLSIANHKLDWAPELAIPEVPNFRLLLLHTAADFFQLFVLPIFLLPRSIWWGLAIAPIAALNNPLWALIHECIHDAFYPSARVNKAAGRWLSILFGSPFEILRLTHLSHHKFNRSPLEKGTEMYEPNDTSRFVAACKYYMYILCGVYLLEVCSAWIFLAPNTICQKFGQRLAASGDRQERWLAKKFLDAKRLREIRIDGLAILLLYGASVYCYGAHHWKPLASIIAVRALLISLLDNIYHYGTPLKVTISGHNLWLPRFLAAGLLYFNYHRIHHAYPNVPWTGLPWLYARRSDHCDDNFFYA
ncbi:MAG TPA: fatty acid desaturase, partial [Candidatus Binatia bacterium]